MNTLPTFAEQASLWLDGQLFADPKDLIRGLLEERKALVAQAEQWKKAHDVAAEMLSVQAKRAERTEAALRAYDEWASRMPDAGFNNTSPRWDWWHERPYDVARAALTEKQRRLEELRRDVSRWTDEAQRGGA